MISSDEVKEFSKSLELCIDHKKRAKTKLL